MRRFGLLVLVCFFAASTAFGAEPQQLLDDGLRDLLHEALSGERAKDHVIQITRHHRIQGSRGYRDAASYVLEQLKEAGYSEQDAFVESFLSDGKKTYQTWQSPSGWDIEWGELRMIEPREERIVGYPEIGMSVITYSNAGDETAELVYVGAGTNELDYEGKDVRGKFVLATGYGGSVHRLAVLEHGAVGVVCFLDDDRAKEYPDMLQYTGMWPRSSELDAVTFGFNLTNRQGSTLRDLLASGRKVVVRGQVRGIGLESYEMDVVVAKIPGAETPEEVLVVSAHLDHPKELANDNASGSAATLDMAATLKALIDSGRLPRPKRSIHFLWVPEYYGTMAYIDAHPEVVGAEYGGTYLANINMDMVGENLELLHTVMRITRTPPSLPSAVNDVVASMAAMVDGMEIRTPRGSLSRFNYRISSYSGGSDHNMFIDRKVPGMMFYHSPDYTHHTSEDTPDKVDPVELERSEIIATSSLLYLSNLDRQQALDTAFAVSAAGAERLGQANLRAQRHLDTASPETAARVWAEAENIVRQSAQQEKVAIASVRYFYRDRLVDQVLEALRQQTDRQLEGSLIILGDRVRAGFRIARPGTLEDSPDGRIPRRIQRGPIDATYLMENLPPDERDWMQGAGREISGAVMFELANFIDGKRGVSQIRHALSAEFEPMDTAMVAHFIDNLVSLGLAEWVQ